jgi:hypothetical protein
MARLPKDESYRHARFFLEELYILEPIGMEYFSGDARISAMHRVYRTQQRGGHHEKVIQLFDYGLFVLK